MTPRLIHVETVDSTNAEAHRLAVAGERGPLWIRADRQTAGRGRLGRNWISEPGNLYATCLFTIAGGPALASQVSFVAALAVLEMAQELSPHVLSSSSRRKPGPNSRRKDSSGIDLISTLGPGFRRDDDKRAARFALKWPNDVLLDGAKFSGILPEAIGRPDGTTIALGCGVNLAHAPSGTPYPLTHLSAHGATATPAEALDRLDRALCRQMDIWQEGRGFRFICEAWLRHAHGLGGAVTTSGLTGIFTGLAPDGALVLTMPDGECRPIHAGEVRFAAPQRFEAGS